MINETLYKAAQSWKFNFFARYSLINKSSKFIGYLILGLKKKLSDKFAV